MTGWADRELVERQQARSRRSSGALIGARRHGAARRRALITLTRAGPYEPGAPLRICRPRMRLCCSATTALALGVLCHSGWVRGSY
jgi:hypothetical protein